MPSLFLTNFNSIKVQLKHVIDESDFASVEFQFHKGTIKTDDDISFHTWFCKFQFHKGTIKTNWLNLH